jgi:hypothetical protein
MYNLPPRPFLGVGSTLTTIFQDMYIHYITLYICISIWTCKPQDMGISIF